MHSFRRLVLLLIIAVLHQPATEQQIISFTGPAGKSCVTSSGFLGNCVSARNCNVDGATADGCPRFTVCCLRVSGTSDVTTSRPTTRPVVIRPPPVQHRLCTYRVPVTPSAPSVGLLAKAGRIKRSPQRSPFSDLPLRQQAQLGRKTTQKQPKNQANKPRPFSPPLSPLQLKQNPTPKLPKTRSARLGLGFLTRLPIIKPVTQFIATKVLRRSKSKLEIESTTVLFTNGVPIKGPGSQGAGIIRPGPRPLSVGSVNVNDVLSKITQSPKRPVAPPSKPVATNRPVVTHQHIVFPSRPPPVQYRTFIAPC
ncbi:uncharacterized protein LOC122363543 [Amphibalanus amphitrite]|uniref:uncharacterized protein LOC122363543 n=1 Tax=Amphibalanus amphitrite TaxID=1232801 RepID=UPI001C915975|nr:uncharacterized protein LOC122363543 [Amphibalanus amphitrite]